VWTACGENCRPKRGAAIYSTRKTVVEPVFGQIKQARGFRQFLLRGLKKVQGEWAIICLTHNILKLHRLCYG
jgi:Transposase DDE domain